MARKGLGRMSRKGKGITKYKFCNKIVIGYKVNIIKGSKYYFNNYVWCQVCTWIIGGALHKFYNCLTPKTNIK